MKKTGQQTRFRDDLRRLLLFYSLLPVLSAVLLLIVFLGYIPLQNVVHGTADNLQLAWDAFGRNGNACKMSCSPCKASWTWTHSVQASTTRRL